MDQEMECISANIENTGSKRKWRCEETLVFISAYGQRKDEFLHPKKKKYAMENVLEDLTSRGVLTEPTTVETLRTKMRSLLRAYKQAKDNAAKTGAGRIDIPYEMELDEIFGNRPMVNNQHSLHLSGSPTASLPVSPQAETSRNKGKTVLTKQSYLEEKLKLKQKYYDEKLKLKYKVSEEKEKRFKQKIDILEKYLEKV